MFRLAAPLRQLLPATALLAALATSGCRAQTTTETAAVPSDLARRVELMIRAKATLPFNYAVRVGERKPSEFTGYDEVTVYIGTDGQPEKPLAFLLSRDGKTLAQMNTFDISKDPSKLVTPDARPITGNAKAPVTIVVFDDLECPFCARMHTQMFPAMLQRYGNNVRIAYKDFPLKQHPWAIHAAVNADCLGKEDGAAFWSYVNFVHANLDSIGDRNKITVDPRDLPAPTAATPAADSSKDEKTLPIAFAQLDKLAREQGAAHKDVSKTKLAACISRQDETAVQAGLKEGESLGISGVPALFINGEMITGAVPIEYVYRAVDKALVAQGVTPPPAVPLPKADALAQ